MRLYYSIFCMKKHLMSVAVVLAALCMCTTVGCKGSEDRTPIGEDLCEDEFLIDGQLPKGRYDSAWIYLVPMQGPHPRPVDSVLIQKDGKFVFRGNVEQMAVLRLSWRQRYGVQDLLVVTEPGVTRVVLDSVSSSNGTPLNNALQQWKEHREASSIAVRQLRELSNGSADNKQEFKDKMEAYLTAEGEYNYNFLKGMGRNTLTVFLNKMFTGRIDSLRRAELNELLIDTVDYTKPQPGFRR